RLRMLRRRSMESKYSIVNIGAGVFRDISFSWRKTPRNRSGPPGGGRNPVGWPPPADNASSAGGRPPHGTPGSSRIYTLTLNGTDPSGHSASATALVVVPHDKGN